MFLYTPLYGRRGQALLDTDGDDGGMDDIFFPGSDDELGFLEEDEEEDEEEGDNEDQSRFVFIIICNNYSEWYQCISNSDKDEEDVQVISPQTVDDTMRLIKSLYVCV